MSLLIVGTVAFDELITPFGESGRIIGGSATYASLSASNLCKDISIVSIIGEDFPEEKLALMRSKGIDTEGIKRVEGGKTFFWKGKYHNDMNSRDSLATELNVLADFDPILPEKAREAEYLMLGNLTPAIQMKVLKQMKQRPKLVVMDTMNFWMDIAMPELKEVLKEVDLLTINDEEARQLSGEYSLVKAAAKIFEMGPKYLIIKKGEHGALLFHGKELFYAPALPLEEVYDPTGAGDTFAGGFIGHVCDSDEVSFESMKRGIIYGSALASFCVEEFGTHKLRDLDRGDLHDRVMRFISLTDFDMKMS
ncbi:PfkB family carbohydrate kinase [Croceimicrobium hydrocarbonivorans]|uniref:Sugar kinase n=1 Tax=Croceimicrobium hydrocarbonivorans TaxID=2761580 RepID=A0A7H0VJJ8_9FLAO|nr:PfkB family carbohydrate kinase [Croceimicrobium hydrocarbonivorans]QNR25896.1 sugar kinase [Croceimicrobium hydrocarbonivorans]